MLEKTLESPLDCKEIKPVNPKGNQSWIFFGRTDAKAKAPVLWPPDVRNWLNGKDPDAGKDWRQEERGMTEDETIGWHHRLDGHEFEQAPGVGHGQGSLACCSPWGHKESDTTERLNWTELIPPFDLLMSTRVSSPSVFLLYTLFWEISFTPKFQSQPRKILKSIHKEGMATYSSILAWRIPWTEEPGGLLSIGLHRVGHDWSDLAHTDARRHNS